VAAGSRSLDEGDDACLTSAVQRNAGRSAAWLARLPWEQEVTSSNLVAPIRGACLSNGGSCISVKTDADIPKLRVSCAGADMIESGMVVGLGSGTTAALMVRRLGERVREEGLTIVAIATSVGTAELASALGIPLRELDDVGALDINLDGADEIDSEFRMIKGRGGALLREKIVASASRHRVTMITAGKRVERLGAVSPVPVEVSPVGAKHIERRIRDLGAETALRRRADGSRYRTDGGNLIIDAKFAEIHDPCLLDRNLQCIPGVLETGLFIDLCDTLIVGTNDGVQRVESHTRERA
jgi:ribose 5-phosphate isomerase A